MKKTILATILLLKFTSSFSQTNVQNKIPDSIPIFTTLEYMPKYRAGAKELNAFFTKNFDFNKCQNFKSSFEFIVTPEGKIMEIKKLSSENNCGDELISKILFETSGYWIPGSLNGVNKYVQARMIIEVSSKDIQIKMLN